MARVQYFVICKDGRWKVSFGGKHFGPYVSQQDAIRTAISAAHEAQGNSQVLIKGHDSKTRVIWTCGSDPFPPQG
jgi:hypothetical protein